MRVLIVEDNRRLAESIRDILKHWYDCDICGDGSTGCWLLKDGGYDAAILDLMLPGMDGITLLKEARKMGCPVPVLILSAKSELEDRVTGLECGADYYLTKPFATEEFLACLRTVLRRHGDIAPDTLSFGDLILTPSIPELCCGGSSVPLSAKELELMSLLIKNSSQYLPKETILLKVWGYDANVNSNSVEAYISFLRKKLALLGSSVSISVMRNIGYKLEVSV